MKKEKRTFFAGTAYGTSSRGMDSDYARCDRCNGAVNAGTCMYNVVLAVSDDDDSSNGWCLKRVKEKNNI